MTSMSSDLLSDAALLGIQVPPGSSHRAWVKAAFLFIRHYVVPVANSIDKELSTQEKEALSRRISLKLFSSVVRQSTDTSSDNKNLPIKKSFISVKKINERFGTPVHSHITQKDYKFLTKENELACQFCKWVAAPSLLVGLISLGDTGNLEFSDKSGKIICCMPKFDSSFIGAVCLLYSWNFIPANDLNPCCLQVTAHPILLVSLLKHSILPQENILNIDTILGMQKQELMKLSIYTVSGILYRIEETEQHFVLLLICNNLEALPSDCHSLPSCVVYVNCDTVKCHPNIFPGFSVIISHVEIQSSDQRPSFYFKSTPTTEIQAVADWKELLDIYYDPDNDVYCQDKEWLGKGEYQYTFSSVYVGKIKCVLNWELGILQMQNDCYVSLLNIVDSVDASIQPGAIIALKQAHVCKNKRDVILVACKHSNLQILEFAPLPDHRKNTKLCDNTCPLYSKMTATPFHPIHLIELCKLSKNLQMSELVLNTFEKRWLKDPFGVTPILQRPADNESCFVRKLVEYPCTPLNFLSVKEVCQRAISRARDRFLEDYAYSDIWCHIVVPFHDLLTYDEKKKVLQNKPLLVAKLGGSEFGSTKICDGLGDLQCLIFQPPTDTSVCPATGAELCNAYHLLPPELLGSLALIRNFLVVVERIWNNPAPVDTEENVQPTSESDSSSDGETTLDRDFTLLAYLVTSTKHIVKLPLEEKSCLADRSASPQLMELSADDSASELAGPSNIADNVEEKSHDLLLFVTHKAQLLKFSSSTSFQISAYALTHGWKYEECHVQFRHQASSCFPHIFPGLLVMLTITASQDTMTSSSRSFCVDTCTLKLITSWDDLPSRYDLAGAKRFHETATSVWKKGFYSDGLTPVYTVGELVVRPPSGDKTILVALRARIVHRISYRDNKWDETSTGHSYRLDLADDQSERTMSIYISYRASASPMLGLLPGNNVSFYRLKLIVSKRGHVYCKYTPTSFHILESSNWLSDEPLPESSTAEVTTTSDSRMETDHLEKEKPGTSEPVDQEKLAGPVTNLYKIYVDPSEEASLVRLKVGVTRLLSFRAFLLCSACGRERAYCNCSRPFNSTIASDPSGSVRSDTGFQAKAIITDGTGRGILYFTHRDRKVFCSLMTFSTEEWDYIIHLLHNTESSELSYDCSRDKDTENLFNAGKQPVDQAQKFIRSLFNFLNTTVFPSREVVLRRQVATRKGPWVDLTKSHSSNFQNRVGGQSSNSTYRLGSVSVDGGNVPPMPSIALTLIKFSCVPVS